MSGEAALATALTASLAAAPEPPPNQKQALKRAEHALLRNARKASTAFGCSFAHMSSHTLAIGLGAIAHATARRYATDRRFAFGTWKIEPGSRDGQPCCG